MSTRKTLFKVLGVAAGLVFAGYGAVDMFSISRTKSRGLVAVVQPISGYTARKQKGMTTYSADFTFKTEAGNVITKRRPFPEELIADFQSNTPVKVRYDARDPMAFVFEKESGSWLLIGAGVGIAVAAVFLL